MTIKISWGKKIALLYLGFVALIVTLVVSSMRQSFDLVSSDYYAKEIAYQNTLDAGKNQAALSEPVAIAADKNEVRLRFPKEFDAIPVIVHLQFYSPVSAAQDCKFDLPLTDGTLIISRTKLHHANYRLKINWTAGRKDYYQESEINLSK